MRVKFTLLLSLVATQISFGQLLDLEIRHEDNQTYPYPELIDAYKKLDEASDNAALIVLGESDYGLPIHALVVTSETTTMENIDSLRQSKWVIAVNNGIHPGESCGVDASLHWLNAMLADPSIDEKTMLVVIPMYNIGGAMNRRPYTRANQNGPINQGFRGNARNYDLNRDLIKADTRNTYALYELFKRFDPEIFVDTHSTNGADYPYEMTLITSPWQKYPAPMRDLVFEAEAFMFNVMEERDVLMSPYVNVFGRTPNAGFAMFEEGAMYTTGYAALCGAVAFVTEAHMLKPYDVRVRATTAFLEGVLELGREKGSQIRAAKLRYRNASLDSYTIRWEIDSSQYYLLDFQSFKAEVEPSSVTTGERLKYSEDVEEVELPYYNRLIEVETVRVPQYYYIPFGQHDIVDRFIAAGVVMDTVAFTRPSRVPEYVVSFNIEAYHLADRPYEGHVMLRDLQVVEDEILIGTYSKLMCYRISTQQRMGRYVVECLEPMASSSFVKWNMFATYFQQKEHYSSYVFEDTAEQLLQRYPDIKARFEAMKEGSDEFAQNPSAQLYWIYQQSEWFEPEYMRLPYFKSV
ncbi:MAG: hypothetical protein EP346_06810, partial [Bacteroidetes bacterium]